MKDREVEIIRRPEGVQPETCHQQPDIWHQLSVAIGMDHPKITQAEIHRVSDNLRSFGTLAFDVALGTLLMYASNEQGQKIKDAFPELWDQWNAELDKNGRRLIGEDE